MAKGEKVKSKSNAKAPPPPPPSDISSSDISDSSSDDESSNEEIDQLTKNLDEKTKLFITKLMEDLESVQAELESREKTLIQQEDLYIASKEALALERSEVESLHKALAKEQGDHAITKKENISLNKKYCDLDEKHKELKLQYNILWDSNPHPSKAKDTSTPSTSQGYGKCYNLDLNAYYTNLANMEAMRKEIARLNEIIGKGCLNGKAQASDKKVNEPKGPQFKQGRHPQSSMGWATQKEPRQMEERL
jgi:chromosome segregation ATPase